MLKFTNYTIVFVLGMLITYILSYNQNEKPIVLADSEAIFRALLEASDLPLPQEQVHCEVAGSVKEIDNVLVYPATSVKDFIAFYLYRAQFSTNSNFGKLTCGTGNIRNCSWRLRVSTNIEEGMEKILKFKYDQKTNSVIPNSLECVDVP